jgi:hypothetical protein
VNGAAEQRGVFDVDEDRALDALAPASRRTDDAASWGLPLW